MTSETIDWLHPNMGKPNPKLEEEARELGQFMIELVAGYRRLEELRAQGASPQKIEEWLDDIAYSTRGVERVTARITELVQEEAREKFKALDAWRKDRDDSYRQ